MPESYPGLMHSMIRREYLAEAIDAGVAGLAVPN